MAIGLHRLGAVARKDFDGEPAPRQRRERLGRVAPQGLAQLEQRVTRAVAEGDQRDVRRQRAKMRDLLLKPTKIGRAQPRLGAIDQRAHPLPALFRRIGEQRRVRPRARHGLGERMAAGARESPPRVR